MTGQTLSEIRRLLAAAGSSPRRRYGQHFLIDLNLMRKLVAAAELTPADTVLEVGCGTGSLTEVLLETGVTVVGVEIDARLQAILRQRLAEHPRLSLIQGDVLAGKHQVNPLVLKVLAENAPRPTGGYKLVANLPYQVATPLIIELLHCPLRFERLVCTVQREVGERLAADSDTPAYGPASVVAQTLATTRPIAILPPAVFWPPPQVESLMVDIRPRGSPAVPQSEVPAFSRFLHEAFAKRRKMLRRVFVAWPPEDALCAFGRAGVSPESRPAELSPAQWQALFQAWRAMRR